MDLYMYCKKDKITKILVFLILILNATFAFSISLSISISGINEKLKENVLENLSLNKLIKDTPNDLDAERIELLHDSSTKEILDVLNSNGYYDASVLSKLQVTKGNYNAKYNITLGKPVYIKKIDIKILNKNYPKQPNKYETDENLTKHLKTENLKLNDIIVHKNYEEAKEEILANFIDHGYLNVFFETHEILIDKDKHSAFINLYVELGPRYYLGDVTFESKLYSNKVLQRYIPFDKGEEYTTKKLEKLRNTLLSTNFFDKVVLKPKPNLKDKKDNIVPILVKIKEKPRKRYMGSIGYLSNLGFKGSLGYLRRHIPENGKQFLADASVSKIIKSLYLTYNIPGRKPIYNSYKLIGGVSDERIKERLSKKAEIGAQKIYKKNHIKNVFGIKYMHELYRVKSTDPKENSSFLLPSFQYTWAKAKDEKEFSAGKKFNIFITGGSKKVLSSTDFLQADIDAKLITKFTEDLRLILRAGVGSIFAKDFDKIPLSMRYFTGGDNSIRGFSYKSIGPTEVDANGNIVTVGGKYRALCGAELEQRIYNNISAAVFVDTGNAMNNWNEAYAAGAGAGVRWHSPLGALKIDLAKPIAKKITKNLRIHLTFGKDL